MQEKVKGRFKYRLSDIPENGSRSPWQINMKPLDTKRSEMIVKKGPHAPGLRLSCFTSEIK